jgi:hypothetical protein
MSVSRVMKAHTDQLQRAAGQHGRKQPLFEAQELSSDPTIVRLPGLK